MAYAHPECLQRARLEHAAHRAVGSATDAGEPEQQQIEREER
jgi:hypothetical protein